MKKLIFLIGASGAGKTTASRMLEKEGISHLKICYFDSIGVPSHEEMIREFGSGEGWQRAKTIEWVKKIKQEYSDQDIVILDAQTRPSYIEEACKAAGVKTREIVLFDCSDEVRKDRLTQQRGQPELATDDMMNWAAYLRKECGASNCRIVDTSKLSIEQGAEALRDAVGEVNEIRAEMNRNF